MYDSGEDNMPLISIIVPVYNVEKYLRACLDSIINQTYKELEIILVDDGSTDGSGSICDEYALMDIRVRVLHNTNCGVSSARNSGLEVAKGECVCFIDSDDTIECNYIECLANAWMEYKCDLVICNIKDLYPNRISLKRKLKGKLTGVFREDYWKLIELLRVPVVKLYRLDIIKDYSLRFPINVNTAEDQIWNFSYYKHITTYVYIDNALYNYFHRSKSSLSQLKNYESYLANMTKLRLEKDFLADNNIEEANEILTNHAFGLLRQFVLISDHPNSFDEFKKRIVALTPYIDMSIKPNSKKQKVLFFLVQHNLLYLVYLYYIVLITLNKEGLV